MAQTTSVCLPAFALRQWQFNMGCLRGTGFKEEKKIRSPGSRAAEPEPVGHRSTVQTDWERGCPFSGWVPRPSPLPTPSRERMDVIASSSGALGSAAPAPCWSERTSGLSLSCGPALPSPVAQTGGSRGSPLLPTPAREFHWPLLAPLLANPVPFFSSGFSLSHGPMVASSLGGTELIERRAMGLSLHLCQHACHCHAQLF